MSRIRWQAIWAQRRYTILVLGFGFASSPQAAQLTTLHHFNNINGASPDGPGLLAQGRDGNLYGTTPSGGTNGVGVAFKLTPAGKFARLYDFARSNGMSPRGGLVELTSNLVYRPLVKR